MKLQVTQENLAKALNTVAKVANSRGTLPILSNVLLKTVGTRLSIAATNLDIAITSFVGSKVGSEGSVTVPGRLMQDFISSLPSGVVDLSLDNNKLHIETGQYSSTINGTAAEEFPVMPAIKNGNKWKISSKLLKDGLGQIIVAASNDEARPVLTGVYLHTKNGGLFAVATDSYRLAEKELAKTPQEISLLIPASALNELLRILPDGDEPIQVTSDEQQVSFKVGDVEMVTRLIEGDYPDYEKLIPDKFETQATLDLHDFTNVTKVSSLFARESAGSVTISADQTKKQLTIESIASQLGENKASASAKITGGGSITLNSRYLLDALNVMTGGTVNFGFNGKLEPCTLTAGNSKDYLHVIMPLKS